MGLWELLLADKAEWAQIVAVALGLIGSCYTKSIAPFSVSLAYLAVASVTLRPLKKPVVVVNGPSQSPMAYLRGGENTRATIVPSDYAQTFNRRPLIANFEATKGQDDELMNGIGSTPGPAKYTLRYQ